MIKLQRYWRRRWEPVSELTTLDALDPLTNVGGKVINWKREWRMRLDEVKRMKKNYCRLVLRNSTEQGVRVCRWHACAGFRTESGREWWVVLWIHNWITWEEALYIEGQGSKEIWRLVENSAEMVDHGVRSDSTNIRWSQQEPTNGPGEKSRFLRH